MQCMYVFGCSCIFITSILREGGRYLKGQVKLPSGLEIAQTGGDRVN